MDNTTKFVLEIGVEELPTSLVKSAFDEFEFKLTNALKEHRLEYQKLSIMGTPRRMVCMVDQLTSTQSSQVTDVKGPARKVGISDAGEFLAPALAFARSQNINPSDLFIARSGKGEYVFGRRRETGMPTLDVLKAVLPKTISSLNFSRTMTWGDGDFRFIRPIRWILALIGDQLIDFQLAQITSSRFTRGHRFLSSEAVAVDSVNCFLTTLESLNVVVDPGKRRQLIEKALDREARSFDGHWLRDEDLIEQVNYLVEYPDAITCRFDEKYLELPSRVLTTVMKHHQKYFACVDDLGTLIPFFLVVLNRPSKNAELVVRGNERVIRARLEDARFFYTEDRKKTLESRVNDLNGILFQENLGTLWDKTFRLRWMSGYLASKLHFTAGQTALLDKASLLSKADLTCEMVKEFPELQGYMARAYLQLENQPEELCAALEDQYLPEPGSDRLPTTAVGSALSLADKLDTIVSSFSIGRIPTGSEDPAGLRRLAQGIIGICRHMGWYLSLQELASKNSELLSEQGFTDFSAEQVRSVINFITNRLRNWLLDNGFHYSLINAVFSTTVDDIYDTIQRVQSLQTLYDHEILYLMDTVIGFTRANNISRQIVHERPVDQLLFEEQEESDLFEKVCEFRTVFMHRLNERSYTKALMSFQPMLPQLGIFFEKVLIMCDDERVRENRLAMMKLIVDTWKQFADLSQIVFPEETT